MSFGIAAAGIVTSTFIGPAVTEKGEMLSSVQHGFWFLGGVTILSAGVFFFLKRDDGDNVSGHSDAPAPTPGIGPH